MMLQCENCDAWRLLYSRKKLTHRECTQLEEAFTFTPLQELDLPGKLADVSVRDIVCGEPVEKLYYSAKYPPICVCCATPVDPKPESDHYPQCRLFRKASHQKGLNLLLFHMHFWSVFTLPVAKYLVARLLSTHPPTSMPGKTPDQKQAYQLEWPNIYVFFHTSCSLLVTCSIKSFQGLKLDHLS